MKYASALFWVIAGLFFASGLLHGADVPDATNKKNYVYTLSVGDVIKVSVYQEDDLTSPQARITAHGQIDLPLIGQLNVGGLTVVEAQKVVQEAYKTARILRNAQVTINVVEYAPREVSIQGQIRNPGRYTLPIESTFTVVELVTKAGGITDIGKGSAVSVTRVAADGSKKVFVIDVDNVIRGRKDQKNDDNTLLLQPGDVVYVPERLI